MGVKVKERPSGSGVYYVYVHHAGERRAKKIGPKDLAEEVARQIEAQLILKSCGLLKKESGSPLFKKYAELWLESYVRTVCRATTYERYKTVLTKYILPELGALPIDQIKKSIVKTLLLKLYGSSLSKSSVSLARDVLSGVLGHAADEELIPANPVIGVLKRLKLKRKTRLSIEPMTRKEVALFLDICMAHFQEWHPFFMTAFRTGMRLGELLALEWGDIDWQGKFIRVKKSYKRGVVTGTKTDRDRRVDMSDELIECLRDLQLKHKKEVVAGKTCNVVFSRKQTHMEQNYIRRVFKRILIKSGIRELRIHDIRHTFASLLLGNGESLAYVKDQLGHSSIRMTVDIYGHLIPGSNRDAVNRLDSTQPNATQTQPQKLNGL